MVSNRTSLGTRGKTNRPEFSRVLPRTRLFELFDRALEHPILWVHAPGGSGKTVAISSYLAKRNDHVLWYSVDKRDNDTAHFFLALSRAAVHCLDTENLLSLPTLTPEYIPNLEVFARNFFEKLFHLLPKPGVLVLDNYQEASLCAVLHEVLKYAGELLPLGLNIVVISREEPPAAFTRLQAHGDIILIGWDQIKLTLEEAQGLADLRRGEAVSTELVRDCHERAQGWAAGVVLLLDYAADGKAESHALNHPNPELLFNYFISEIFGRLPAITQNVLMQIALLPRITLLLAENLTQNNDVSLILADLQQHSFFIAQREGQDAGYEFHPLFHKFLILRANQVFGVEQINYLQRKAAELLYEGGWQEEAVPLFLAVQDWLSLSIIIQTLGQKLLMEGRHQTLALWLNAVPETAIRQDAWLLYYQGYALLPGDPERARQNFSLAFSLFEQQDDVTGEYLAWCAVIDSYIMGWSDFSGLDPWIETYTKLAERHPDFPSIEVEIRVHIMLLALLHARPQHSALPAWAASAQRLLISGDYGMQGIYLAGALMHYYSWIGDFLNCESVLKLAKPRLAFSPDIPVITLYFLTQQAFYQWSVGNGQTCIQLIYEGLNRAEAKGIHLWDLVFCTQGVMGCLITGDLTQAQQLLEHSRHALQSERSLDNSNYHFTAGLLAAHNREWPQAKEHFKLSLHFGRLSEMLFGETYGRMGLIHALFELGEDQEAERELKIIHGTLGKINARPVKCEILMTEARRELNRGNRARALEHLAQGLALCRECGGFVASAYWGPEVITQLYTTALEAKIEVPFVQDMIRRLGLHPLEPGTAPESWPWPIRIQTLGQFKIIINDEALSWTGKTQRKPLELLKALIAFAGQNVPEEKLCEAVWPDTDGDAAHRDFSSALYRLRRLLGNDKALRMENSRLSLEDKLVWLDSACFEARLRSLNASSALTDNQLNNLHLAVALYRGEFLPDENAHWILPVRSRLSSKFCRAAEAFGKTLETKNQYQAAVDWYQKILETDPQLESIYNQQMQCYERLG